jgi:putative ABC transport system substrate-binding protein
VPLLDKLPVAAAIVGLTLLPSGRSPAEPVTDTARVLVVVSQDGPAYRDALTSFRRTLEQEKRAVNLRVIQLDGNTATARQLLPATAQADLVLTLGTLATRETLRRYPATPLVAGMILSADELNGSPNATGVFLQFSIQTELEYLTRMFPSLRRVGVIYHSMEVKQRVARAERVAAESNLTIQAYQIDGPEELPDALKNLADRADVLWGVTDPVVFNPETARSLLIFSFRNQIPLIGHSTPWVKAGALYALDRDYGDIGVQCAELAEKIFSGRAPSTLPPVPPRKIRYTLNRKTVEQMKLELPERVFRDAAEVVE